MTTFFNVSASSIRSMWHGKSENLVKALFKMAKEKKPSIIFFDEFDSLVASRDGPDTSESTKGIVTEFCVQLNGAGK